MGGNAVPGVRRVSSDEYSRLVEEAKELIKKSSIFFVRVEEILSYRNKTDFGDIDLLIDESGIDDLSWKSSLEALGVKELFTDGRKENILSTDDRVSFNKVYSFAYKDVQVDCIFTPKSDFDAAKNYFSWNDLGNLLGVIFKSLGLKLGHDGLSFLCHLTNPNLFREISISKDWSKILPIIGLSPEVYKEGFDDLDDIFRFVASSPFFHKDLFLLENRNATSRIRDKKRKTYMSFLKWCEALPDSTNPLNNLYPTYGMVLRNFPEFKERIREVEEEHILLSRFKEKFNGELIGEITGLTDKDLGELIKAIKYKVSPDRLEFQKKILDLSELQLGYLIGLTQAKMK